MNYPNGGEGNVLIAVGNNATTVNYWLFDNTGNTTFPRNIAPNTTDPILTIVGGATPTIRSDEFDLTGPANLDVSALTTIFTGSSGSAIKIYPDDGEVASDGNLQIWANSGGNTEYSWTFDTTGNLTLPGNLVIAGNTDTFGTNLSLIQSNNDVPLLSLSSGSNGAVSSLWVEDIGNVGTSNIAAVYANPTVGSKIVRIAVGQNGNGGPSLWDFNASGALTLPQGSQISETSNTSVNITANTNTWAFGVDGNLTIPGSSGGFIKTVANASIGVAAVDNGTNNPAQLLSMTNAGAATSIISAYATNATIQTNAAGTINTWSFDNAGNLTLPGNTFAVNYANGTQISLGGSSISNGNSNINIATANGNVTIAAVGNTTMTVTGTGANVTGTLNVTGNITGNTNGFAIGYLNIPQVAAANTTLALSDAGKHYYSTSSGNFTLTIPNNATTTFATGTAISIVVQATGNVLVNAASGVTLYMAGNSTAANRVVSNYGMATIMKVATDTWMINGTGVA
jgi:hypothetical protein